MRLFGVIHSMYLNEVHLGIGSNLGDRVTNVKEGLRCLREQTFELKTSNFYETIPKGFNSQPMFINVVCKFWTNLNPFQLLHEIKKIEYESDRTRAFINAPRTLDIDILFYGDMVIDLDILKIPHPEIANRLFVLEPLCEISPSLTHSLLGNSIENLLIQSKSENIDIESVFPLIVKD